jgi:hypothetical protein
MKQSMFNTLKRVLRKPPHVIAKRIAAEIKKRLHRHYSPRRARKFNLQTLLKLTASNDLNQLWGDLAQHAYPAYFGPVDHKYVSHISDVITKAEQALDHQANLLGSGVVDLGENIQWNKDYKTGFAWHNQYCFDIDYNNFDQPSDVKFPWELSRLQWLIPVGRALWK